MEISHRMVIPTLLLFVLFIVDLVEGHNRCGHHGPEIRFPFRLKDRQPDQHSGYPGFDLYCSDKHDTVLELPTSVKVFVNRIDYKSQSIQVADSDNCFPQKILRLNLSLSPFQFKNDLLDYALFNCTPDQIQNLTVRSIVLVAFQPQFMLLNRMGTSTPCPYYHVQRCIAFHQFHLRYGILLLNCHGPNLSAETVKGKARNVDLRILALISTLSASIPTKTKVLYSTQFPLL